VICAKKKLLWIGVASIWKSMAYITTEEYLAPKTTDTDYDSKSEKMALNITAEE
jgi:hypothetical protein